MSYGMFFDRLPKALIPVCKLHGAMILTQVYWDVTVTPEAVGEMLGVEKDVREKILKQLVEAGLLRYGEDDNAHSLYLEPKALTYFEPVELNKKIKASLEHVKASPTLVAKQKEAAQSKYDPVPLPKVTDPDLLTQLKVIKWLKGPEKTLPDDLREEAERIQTPHIKTFCVNAFKRKLSTHVG